MKKTLSTITNLFPYADLILLHFPAGVLAALLALVFTSSPYEMIRLATEAGFAKEIWDFGRSKKITYKSVLELVFTILGGVAVAVWYF